jgi:hypothetical protein
LPEPSATVPDLNRILPPGSAEEVTSTVTVTTEDKKVRDARLERERKDADARRQRDWVLFALCVVAYSAAGVVAFVYALDADPAHATQTSWARSIVTALMGVLGGLVAGRKIG